MSQNVLIAAGGSGGHIFPALSIAAALKERNSQIQITFIGAYGGMEEKMIPAKGFPLRLLPISRLHRSVGVFEQIKTLFLLPVAMLKSIGLLLKYRPQLVLGVGGHASGPFVLMASLLGFRTAIWEPNAHPGLANRWLSRFVSECLVVLEQAIPHFKNKNCFQVGMPIRKEIEALSNGAGRSSDSKTHVLVFGGSQGARPINNVFSEMLVKYAKDLQEFVFVHQTGPLDYPRISELYKTHNTAVECHEFLYDMDKRYAWADITVSRSGGTVFELAAARKAAVMIPLPTASDNHQQKNAEALVAGNAGIMILQKDLTPEKLKSTLIELKNNPQQRKQFEDNIRVFHKPKAADRIAQHLLEGLR